MITYDEQREHFDQIIKTVKIFTSDESLIKNLREFLDNINVGVKPCTMQYRCGWVGVQWNTDDTTLSVLFGPDDRWEYSATTHKRANNQYTVHYSSNENSGPSFTTPKVGAHYYLPGEILKLVAVPDEFSQEYTPMVPRHDYDTIWVTDRYDGPLSGYCRLHETGNLYYFNYVEETDFEQKRMFAVYELSWWEGVKVWFDYFTWHATLHYNLLWKIQNIRWQMRHRDKTYYDKLHAKAEHFKKTHKIVGYFER